MERSLAQGRPPTGPTGSRAGRGAARASLLTGVAVVFVMLVIYGASNLDRGNFYNHFVWQASAWLEGHADIRYPVYAYQGLGASNDYFQDVLETTDAQGQPTGRGLIPFPPLPAVVLLPFVALFGLTTNAQLIATILGALDVGLAFWVLGRLPVRPSVRLATTVFFGLGTVFWYAAELGSTWFLAHVVAVGLTLLAVGVALDADPRALAGAAHDDWEDPRDRAGGPPARSALAAAGPSPSASASVARSAWRTAWPLDGRQVLAGLLLGLAATARLTVVLGLPFFALVGGGGGWVRRGLSAAVGAAIPIAGLLVYNLVSTGHLFSPVYEHLYQTEISFYPPIFPYLHYHADWSIEDPRYIPQNLVLMLAGLPQLLPSCDVQGAPAGILQTVCRLQPRADGMSLLLTSPALLLGVPALRAWGKGRIVTGAGLAILLIAIADLMHFSQGWVQFGYRFSNDFIPFLLLIVALGMDRLGGVTRLAVVLIGLSIAVNLWGVAWGHILGW